jgi:NhaP-type Na+/H+ or K+/H+ antiporter
LNFFVFYLFGMIAAPLLAGFGIEMYLFAAASLTIVRMLPVAVAMIGTRLKAASVAFLGWFGPRGLASIVLGLVFLERDAHLDYTTTISQAVAATVLLSVFAHGLTALPGMRWYARKVQSLDAEAPELAEVVSSGAN